MIVGNEYCPAPTDPKMTLLSLDWETDTAIFTSEGVCNYFSLPDGTIPFSFLDEEPFYEEVKP